MVPLLKPPVAPGTTVVFVPVDPRLVFCVCAVCVLLCLGWFVVLWRAGRKQGDV